ncbi:GntT/GntP/DsdX family permease [Actinocatenispora rupis]|uniref:Gluconate permease n=1 Tax=Actinocatenispora rupis TaxID=519421 RepID=A0A8J3J9H5_9ACTN|nr:gluconate:H+ symporter [Actinocatenispora rupis]GID12597.1 gluconate permease [Actinocatenispora rupis]
MSIALVIALITTRIRMHAFLALMIGSLAMGLLAGLAPDKVALSFETGVGAVLGNVGVVVALGTMLGKLLAESGGAQQIADTLLRHARPRAVPWIMALVAGIIGIPMFFEIGLVLMLPLILTMARQVQHRYEGTAQEGAVRRANVYIMTGIPALAGLSVLHGLVPPHPGPLAAITAIHADLGQTLLIGLIIAVPTVIIAGPLFATVISRYAHPHPTQKLLDQVTRRPDETTNPPGFGVTLFTILLPVALMLLRTVAEVVLPADSPLLPWASFVGEPIVALLIALIVAMFTFGVLRGFGGRTITSYVGDALMPAAGILLIIGAGGGFKQILIDSGIADAIKIAAQHSHLSALLLAWGVAVLIRLATGSATVATVTAAGIMAPLVASPDVTVNRPLWRWPSVPARCSSRTSTTPGSGWSRSSSG